MQSRREFLKTSTFLLSSLSVLPALAMDQAQPVVKGIYVPGWFGVSKSKIDSRMNLLEELGCNTLMIDVKNAHGEIFYAPNNTLAKEISAQVQTKGGHTRYLQTDYLQEQAQKRNIRLIARHVCFRDRILHQRKESTRLLQHNSEYWADPRLDEVLEYNLELLEQESTMGFDEIVLDYIRFPATSKFGSQKEKNSVIAHVVEHAKKVVGATDLGVQVFGYVAWDYWRAGVGQDLLLLSKSVDVVYPMIYPSHFHKGSFGYDDPNKYPYEFIAMGYQEARKKVNRVMPMIQAFSYPSHKISAQLKAVEELKMPGFIAWNPSGKYEKLHEALVIQRVQ